MINIDEIKEKVKNDDGRMSTSGFIIAMAVLFVGMFAIVLVTFAVSRMSRAVTGGEDSSYYESAAEISSAPADEPESEQPVSASERLNDPDVQAALAYMASPEEVSDVSTRDMSQYLGEMPKDSEMKKAVQYYDKWVRQKDKMLNSIMYRIILCLFIKRISVIWN